MKRLFTLLTAVMLLIAALIPAMAEDTAVPMTLEVYLACADAHAADYGYTLSWQQHPYEDDMTMTICDQFGGNPVLLSTADGTLFALTTGAIYDPEHPELFSEDFVTALLFAFAPILRAEGMDKEEVTAALADFCNADSFLPGIASVMETGQPMDFTFRGYKGNIELLDVGGQCVLALLLLLSEPYAPDEQTPAPAVESSRDVPLTADFIAATDELAADYGGVLEWFEVPLTEALTGHICSTLGGNPTLVSGPDGTLVAISITVPIDSEQMQATFDSFIGAMMTPMLTFLYLDGADRATAMERLTPILNADGFIPGIIDVMTQGGMMEFAFMGYEAEILRTAVDGAPTLIMLMVLQPDIYYAE